MSEVVARVRAIVSRPAFLASAAIVLAVIVGNALFLFGLRSSDPMLYYSGLGSPGHPWVSGHWTIDPNVGYTVDALGHRAALSWLHGHVPLWNPFEGLGQPLGGEMQSGALFLPYVLLQALPHGVLLMHVALELTAGFSALLFFRMLKVSWTAATVGACLFALNGTFAVLTNAPFNPIAFLPATLLGIELIIRALEEGRRPRVGLWVVVVSLALSLLAGFPETAFLDGLLIAAWVVIRVIGFERDRRRLIGWSLLGLLGGVALASPALIAFKDFLDFGNTAYHGSGSAAPANAFALHQFPALTLPFVGGSLKGGAVAGYVTVPTLFLAVVGFLGRRPRAMKVILGLLIAALVANMYHLVGVHTLINLFPGMDQILVYRYGLPVIEFGVILWAVLGFDAIGSGARRWLVAGAIVVVDIAVAAAITAHHNHGHHLPRMLVTLSWALLVLAALAALVLWGARRPARARLVGALVAALVIADATATFAVPQLSASAPSSVDTAPIRYLQQNLGTSRFFSIGPIQPNYGSYWGLSQLNVDDLPVPAKMTSFVAAIRPEGALGRRLSQHGIFSPYELVAFSAPVHVQTAIFRAYLSKQSLYREAAVKFLVATPGAIDATLARSHDLRRVFGDRVAEIWEDAKASPYYTTVGSSCRLEAATATSATVDCAAPAKLVRREIAVPGSTATVAGVTVSLTSDSTHGYQVIAVPRGRSVVVFAYRPPHFTLGVLASLAVVLVMLLDVGWALLRRRRSVAEHPAT